MGTQYKSLLGLTEVIADSAEISNIDLEATNITGLTTSRITEGTNLYYTDARVSENPNVSSNTTHRERKDNPHGVTAAQVGIQNTDDIIEGVTNLYYTDIRFDDRLATKTTTSLAEGANLYYTTSRANADFDARLATKSTTNLTEGANLYYTDARFDTRLATKTTTDLTEGTNLYYTDVRFDNRLAIKTTTNLTEGTNLYYTDVRFDNRLATKTTTNLIEGANLYYTDVRFDNRLATKTTTDLTEGANLYYTTTRANADFDARLATKTTDDLTEGTNLYYTTTRANADFDTRLATKSTDNLAEGTNLYYTDVRFDNRLATKTTTDLTEGANLYYTDVRFDNRLATKTTTNLNEGTNLYYTDSRFDARLATKTTDDLTEGKNNIYYTETRVSANADVKANTAYTAVGHLPLSGGVMTGEITWDTDIEIQTWVSDTVYTPSDDANWSISSSSIYDSNYRKYEAFNKTVDGNGANCWISAAGRYNTNGTVNASTYTTEHVDGSNSYQGEWIQVRHTEKKIRLTSFILTARSKYTEYSKSYRLLGTNDDPTTVTANWTTLMASSLSWGSPGASLVLTPETRLGYYNTYRLLITQCTVAYCSIARFIPLFVTEGNTISNVFSINGAHVDTLIADVKTNSEYAAIGHLPLAGGTLTGDLNLGGNNLIDIGVIKNGVDITVDDTVAFPVWTSNTSANSDGWFISSSSVLQNNAGYDTFKAVDNSANTSWIAGGFNQSTGVGSAWYKFNYTPEPLLLTSITIRNRISSYCGPPRDFTIEGSNDDTKWTVIYSTTENTGWASGESRVFALTGNDRYFNYHRIFITRIQPSVPSGVDYVSVDFPNLTLFASRGVFEVNEDGVFSYRNLDITGDLTVEGELNIGGEKITTGATNGLQLYGPSSDIGGPHIQAFVSTDDYPVFQQLNNSHGSIGMCFDAYADGFTWKSSSTSNAIIYKSNTDLEFSYSSGVAVGGEVTWNAGFSMDLANGLVSFSNGVDVTGDLTVSGTVDGVDLKALETDVKANTTYRNTGHLPLAGGTLTGDLTVSGEINIGGAKIARGATNGLQLYGTLQNLSGPHLQAFVSTDTYPTYQLLNWSHNNVNMTFDAYYDGSWRSSSTASNFLINKGSTLLAFNYDSGIDLGGAVTWNAGFSMNTTNGLVTCYNGLEVTGNITISGTVDGVDLDVLNTDVKANTAYRNTGHLPLAGGTLTGNLNMGNNSIDNISRIFIDRNGAANNKIVLYDGGTPSTTNFYGFGVQSATLLYNVDSSAANHKFYYGGTNELFRIGDAAVYSYRDLDVKGNITVSGTVDGVDLKALETAVDTNTAKVSASGSINTHSDVNITTPADGHVLTYTSGEWKNIAPAAADGYLPLDGTTAMTGSLNIDPSNHGEKLVFHETTTTEVPYGIQTSNGFIMHGVEYNGSHVFIYDIDGKLATAGYLLQLKRTGSIMNTELSMNNHKITDLTTPTDTADATTKGYVDTAVNAKLSVNGTSIMIGNLNMGNYDIDNVNQVFVNRSGLANNKLVLLDNGSGSTTDFYGFGIGAATLMYNINSTGANHKFYYAGIYELFRIGHEGVYSYRNLDVTGNITVSGTVDGVDLKALNTTVGEKLALTGGTMSGNINMGNRDIDNVNQVFINRSSTANNKLVLWDNGSGSTTSFYGLGIQSSTLLYNVAGSSANHRFFYDGSNELFRIGNSGVYTYRGLGVTGNILMSTNSRILIDDSTSSACGIRWADDNHAIYCYRSANQMFIKEFGTMYFQTTGAETRAYINSSGLTNLSDRRKKSGIREMKCRGIDLINALKPVCFTHIGAERENCGFIAQDIEELVEQKKICFNPVTDNRREKEDGSVDEFKGLCYIDFIAPLVKAVQELSTEVNTLKNRIELLESPII